MEGALIMLFVKGKGQIHMILRIFIAAAVSKPEENERGSSLIGKKLHKGILSLFLARRKELWLCANERFRMHNGLARNCGYVRMEDLGCAVDSQGIVVMLEWEI